MALVSGMVSDHSCFYTMSASIVTGHPYYKRIKKLTPIKNYCKTGNFCALEEFRLITKIEHAYISLFN